MDTKENVYIRRSKERLKRKPEVPKNGDNFRFVGWGGVLATKVIVREEK